MARSLFRHPMFCDLCGAQLTNPDGVTLRNIRVREAWTCETHEPEILLKLLATGWPADLIMDGLREHESTHG